MPNWKIKPGSYSLYLFCVVLLMTSCKFEQSTASSGQTVDIKNDKLLKQIFAVRKYAKYPIGIVIGKQSQALCKTNNINIENMSEHEALEKIANDSGFLFSEDGGTYVLKDKSIAPWMQDILDYRIKSFPAVHHVTMDYIGLGLTTWIGAIVADGHGSGWSITGSQNLQFYDLDQSENMTVQEIANKIAALNQNVVWVMRPVRRQKNDPPKNAADIEVRFFHSKDLDQLRLDCCGMR